MDLIESIIHTSEKSVDVSKKYLLTSYKYTKLKVFYLLTKALSTIIKVILVGGFIFTGFLFIVFASAIALGQYLENSVLGYVFVGLGMMLFGFFSLLFRKKINQTIIKKISQHF